MIQDLYDQLNDLSLNDKQEKIFTQMFNKFLENYNRNSINSKNFGNFKEDTYLVFDGLYKYIFQEDIYNEDDISEKELHIFNELKNHIEYILNNINQIEYNKQTDDNPIYDSIKIVSDFIKQQIRCIQ